MTAEPNLPDQPPVALVTGAGQRIGAAITRQLHAAGYAVVLHYRHSADAAQRLARELDTVRANSCLTIGADLADLASLAGLVEASIKQFGRLDLLVNNASAFYATPLEHITEADWDGLFAANAKAPLFLAQAARPYLRASGGNIINLTDIYAERGLSEHAVYVMAKAALVAMTKSLALELAPAIRVNAIAPGAILWPQHDHTEKQQAILDRTPLQRTGTPADIASAVLWLAQAAPFVTGQIMAIDGGRQLGI